MNEMNAWCLFSDEDEPLFMSLIMDLFPNVIFEKTVHHNLEQAIKQQVELQGLVFHEPWILKLVQVTLKKGNFQTLFR